MKRIKGTRWQNHGGMSATVTAGGENKSMGGIDRVNLRQGRETNRLTHSRKLGQTGWVSEKGGREGGRRQACKWCDDEVSVAEIPTDFIKAKMTWKSNKTDGGGRLSDLGAEARVNGLRKCLCWWARPLFVDAESVSCLCWQRSGRRLRCWIVTGTGSSPNRSWEWPCALWGTCPARWSWPSSCRD